MLALKRNWFSMSWSWYEDEVLEAIADNDDAVLKVWPVLVAMAKKQSDEATNPEGRVTISAKRLARATYCDEPQLLLVLAMLEQGKMVRFGKSDVPGTLLITPVAFGKWNVPRGSDADRQRYSRAKPFAGTLGASVTQQTETVTHRSPTPTQTQTQTPTTTRPEPPREQASERRVWAANVVDVLLTKLTIEREWLTDQILLHATGSRGKSKEAYMRAAEIVVRKLGAGEQIPNPMGYYFKTVPGCEHVAEVRDDAYESPESKAKRERSQRRAAHSAALKGGGA